MNLLIDILANGKALNIIQNLNKRALKRTIKKYNTKGLNCNYKYILILEHESKVKRVQESFLLSCIVNK